MGSGQFGTPWERMHWLNVRMPLSSNGTSAGGNGRQCRPGAGAGTHSAAAWYRELLTPSCCAPGNFALLAPAWGSGKFGTPFERMHWEKVSSCEFGDPPAFVEPPEPAAEGLPAHAAADRTTAADAMTAAALRTADSHAHHGRRMTRVQWFITPTGSTGVGFTLIPEVLRPDG